MKNWFCKLFGHKCVPCAWGTSNTDPAGQQTGLQGFMFCCMRCGGGLNAWPIQSVTSEIAPPADEDDAGEA